MNFRANFYSVNFYQDFRLGFVFLCSILRSQFLMNLS